MNIEKIKNLIKADISNISNLSDKVDYINNIRSFIHDYSPFKNEPVDFVKWEVNENVVANDYNPNKVAPPEMELLEVSIMNDGYTQPIVTWANPEKGKTEVIDGFHRNRVGKESIVVKDRVKGYLPVVDIRKEQSNKNDRIASTIRHNRARGKHQVDAMSEIVLELKNRNWKNSRIAKELGMDEDEILRLCQISGLSDIFKDSDFSRSWNIEDSEFIDSDEDYLNEIVTEEEKNDNNFRTVNTNNKNRIFHTFDKWECHKAGFYNSTKEGYTKTECENEYLTVLTDRILFSGALSRIISEWKYSCEHYLTNTAMNRIAWLGQAAVCLVSGVPSKFSSGWSLLSDQQQKEANEIALEYLNVWLERNNHDKLTLDEALSIGRQVNIY